MDWFGWFALILGTILCLTAQYKINHQRKLDKETEEKNEKLLEEYNKTLKEQEDLLFKIKILTEQEHNQEDKIKRLNNLTENMNDTAAAAFEKYCDALEAAYAAKENEFSENLELLDEAYLSNQVSYINELNKKQEELDKIKATRAAAIKAQLKEQEIKEQKNFYTVNISNAELNDVKILQEIEYKLNNPRVLRMLIWSTFFRDAMNKVCNNVLGTSPITGIYKITNQLNNMCYIGQSVDIAKRWKDHAKCGLGIDAPVSNKLYNAMQQDGLNNFTFELLEECKTNELNEKEKYFIELYQSDRFGYNQTGGNK